MADLATEIEDTINEAWRVQRALMLTGEATLRSGRVVRLRDSEVADTARVLSQLKKPKVDKMPIPEDFAPRVTTGG